jgi:flagellar basal-body rod modification protein FlgD
VSNTGNASLERISTSYKSNESEKSKKEDALGRDTFLTMLVAQLQNQDPLNPMDGTDFSAQLAQFSQLEQLINLNESMENMAKAFSNNSEGDVVNLVGKQVTGNVDVMNVDEGTVSGGFYNLSRPADVMITVTDASGKTVKTLYDGQQTAGSHLIRWDGTDNNGKAVEDGSYNYKVMANSGTGYAEVPASLTGKVEGVTYNNGKAYLVVQGILLDPKSLTAVSEIEQQNGSSNMTSPMEYIGKTVSSSAPIVLVEDGTVNGSDLGFHLEKQDDVTINIYDAFDELVRTITISSDDTQSGDNTVAWDGVTNSGYQAADGLYYYTVKADSAQAKTPVTEEVSGIKYMNNSQYLVLKESGRLISLSSITGISS